MEIEVVRVPPRLVKKNRHEFARIKRLYIKYMAYQNKLPFLNPTELEQAKEGHLSEKYSIHHQIPLSCCLQPNKFSNLVILPIHQHKHLHKTILNPQLEGFYELPYYSKRVIEIPDINKNFAHNVIKSHKKGLNR